MAKLGRRTAYIIAGIFALVSASLSATGILTQTFALFCAGTLLAGYYAAHVQSFRFAVVEGLPKEQAPKAISRVMIGGLIAAVIGPQVVVWTQDAMAVQYVGAFVGQAVLVLIGLGVIIQIRDAGPAPKKAKSASDARLIDLLKRPRYTIAVAAGVVSYTLMAFVMTAAPIAMVDHGHEVKHAALGIQWHVLAMFAPSFFTGKLMVRFGKARITALGLILIALAGIIALQGLELAHFWGSLILLGVGWNFGFIGATALVAEAHTPEEKGLAQGFNDFMIFSTVALGSFMAGVLLNASGWYTLNLVVMPICALVLAVMLLLRRYPLEAAAA
jgi:predicted MFS family arabinose efflux permease